MNSLNYDVGSFRQTFKDLPPGCSYGQECSSCELGAKYADTSVWCKQCSDSDTYMYGMGSVRTIYNVDYAVCSEVEDCSAGEHANCQEYSSGLFGGNGENPLNPNL